MSPFLILGVDDISSDNFMSKLDNGVVVCKLSKIIQEQCDANLHAAVNGKLGAVLFPDEHDDGVSNRYGFWLS